MARRKEIESTPIPIDEAFKVGDSITGRLTGNAFDQSAKLDIFYSVEDEFFHITIDGFAPLMALEAHLQDFIAKMQSKGSH